MGLIGTPLSESDLTSLAECGTDSAMAEYPQLGRVYSFTGGEIVGRNDSGCYAGIVLRHRWPQEPHIREYRLRGHQPEVAQPIAKRRRK
jgi:hypothetical protein